MVGQSGGKNCMGVWVRSAGWKSERERGRETENNRLTRGHGDTEEKRTTTSSYRHSGHHACGVMSRNPDVSVVKLLNRDEGDAGDKSQSNRGK
jgi:hypothetical protein